MTTNIDKLIHTDEHDPHQLLGLHFVDQHRKVIRLWRPGAQVICLELFGKVIEAVKIHDAGLFECEVPLNTTFKDYRVYHQSGLLGFDPYACWPTIGELDQYLFGRGVHYHVHEMMGGRLINHQDCAGAKFVVWAPSARRVSLLADFNHWDGRVNPMRSLGSSGLWEIFIPGLAAGEKYKFEIKTQSGAILVKADPYAYASELRPATASVLASVNRFDWEDADWIARRGKNEISRSAGQYL